VERCAAAARNPKPPRYFVIKNQISKYNGRRAGRVLAARILGVSYFMQSSSEPWMARTNNAQLVFLIPIFVHAENIFEYGFALPGAICAL